MLQDDHNGCDYVFCLLTPVVRTEERDPVLGLSMVGYDEEAPFVVGVNAIAPARPYIAPIGRATDNTERLVLVEWSVRFL